MFWELEGIFPILTVCWFEVWKVKLFQRPTSFVFRKEPIMDKVTCERAVKALTLFMVTRMIELITRQKALPEFFLCIFSSLTSLKKPVFSKRDLLRWKVPARLYWDFLTSGGTNQRVTISKKWKNLSSALRRKRTWVEALLLHIIYSAEVQEHHNNPLAVRWRVLTSL